MNELSKFLKFMYEARELHFHRLVFFVSSHSGFVFFSLSHSPIANVYLIKQIPVGSYNFALRRFSQCKWSPSLDDPSNLHSIIPKTRLSSGANSVCYLSLWSSLSLSLFLFLFLPLSPLMGGSVCVCALEQALHSLSGWTIFFWKCVWEREILCAFYCPSW